MSYFFKTENDNNPYFQLFVRLAGVSNIKESVGAVLEAIGDIFGAKRVSVFEFNKEVFSNTYEWCAPGVEPWIKRLKNESIAVLDSCYQSFMDRKYVFLNDVEASKDAYPATYAVLKVKKIASWIAVPIYMGDEMLGFIGVADCECELSADAIAFMETFTNIIAFRLKAVRLEQNNDFLATHDRLTSVFDQVKLSKDLAHIDTSRGIGILNADIIGLNDINIKMGAKKGDEILYFWSSNLKFIFNGYKVYRVCGDKFTVICEGIDKALFESKVVEMRTLIMKYEYQISIGTVYCDKGENLSVKEILKMAEHDLYKSKARYYGGVDLKSGLPRERRHLENNDAKESNLGFVETVQLKNFLMNNYFDMDLFFESVSMANSAPYFGDLQTNIFYVSQSMCDMFGLEHFIVEDLLSLWKNFIPYEKDKIKYNNDVEEIFEKKKATYDFRYRIKDRFGDVFWIRCTGIIKWDDDKIKPLFLSGAITKIDSNFDLDPITLVPREQLALQKINDSLVDNKSFTCVGFKLNNFDNINQLNGRKNANSLLKDIISTIQKKYNEIMEIYRLDGLRFVGFIYDDANVVDIANDIKLIINDMYSMHKLSFRYPSAIGVLMKDDVKEYLSESKVAIEFLEKIINLIETAKNSPERDMLVFGSSVDMQSRKQRSIVTMDLCQNVMNNFENFRAVIQPVVSADSGKVLSGEMLLRWQHNGENVSPMVFIPILEQRGLIISAGRWIFEEAVINCKRINTHNPDFYLNFNLSYHQILDAGLIDFMKKTLEAWDLDGSRLVMELTETHENDNPQRLAEFVDECRKLGFRIAIDDFGIGYSSLDLLLRYHSDIVKLDRSLIKRMTTSKVKYDFMKSMVDACHKLGKVVCAEGVETEEELELVRDAGCDVIQGFYFYKPMELVNVFELLTTS